MLQSSLLMHCYRLLSCLMLIWLIYKFKNVLWQTDWQMDRQTDISNSWATFAAENVLNLYNFVFLPRVRLWSRPVRVAWQQVQVVPVVPVVAMLHVPAPDQPLLWLTVDLILHCPWGMCKYNSHGQGHFVKYKTFQFTTQDTKEDCHQSSVHVQLWWYRGGRYSQGKGWEN